MCPAAAAAGEWFTLFCVFLHHSNHRFAVTLLTVIIHHSLVAPNSIKTSTNLYNSCRLNDSLSCTLVTTTDYGIKYLLSPSRKSGGFTRRHCPSVCLFLFVCRLCRRYQACPTRFLLGEKLSREIYASGGGLLVVSINASHLFLDRCAVACCTAIK